jgi:hypothetical protein
MFPTPNIVYCGQDARRIFTQCAYVGREKVSLRAIRTIENADEFTWPVHIIIFTTREGRIYRTYHAKSRPVASRPRWDAARRILKKRLYERIRALDLCVPELNPVLCVIYSCLVKKRRSVPGGAGGASAGGASGDASGDRLRSLRSVPGGAGGASRLRL